MTGASDSTLAKSFDNIAVETLAFGTKTGAYTVANAVAVELSTKAQDAGITTLSAKFAGGEGADTLTVDASKFTSSRSLTFVGSDDANVGVQMKGGAGNDTFTTGKDNTDVADTLLGGAGADTFNITQTGVVAKLNDLGKGGQDVVIIKSGSTGVEADVTVDWVATSATQNNVSQAAGQLDVDSGIDVNVASATGPFGYEILATSNALASTLQGSGLNDSIVGGSAADSIVGNAGDDNITGGAEADTINAGSGTDTITDGGAGADVILYDAGTTLDLQNTGTGVVTLTASKTGVTVTATDGVRTVNASTSTAAVNMTGAAVAAASAVTYTGGTKADTIIGGAGADVLTGNAGNDTITGGDLNDTLVGGDGVDTFVYTTVTDSNGVTAADVDVITNLVVGSGGDLLDFGLTGTLSVITADSGVANFAALDTTAEVEAVAKITGGAGTAGAGKVFTGGSNATAILYTNGDASKQLIVDVNGDGAFTIADVNILVTGVTGSLATANFV
jgi:Ca2+-binding RTX toxin-like protein